MKQKPGKNGLGALLTLIAIIGIIFSLFGIAITWYMKPKIQSTVYLLIDSIDQIMINTEAGIVVLDGALEGAAENLDIISATLDNLNSTIDSISVSLGSSADLIGGDLRLTIIDTQTALSSAASSAVLIDNTLRIIAALPLMPDYRPDVPLSISLEQVSESLDDVPESFLNIEQYIRETDDGMLQLKTDVTQLSSDIRTYENDLVDTRAILTEYDLILDDLREQLSNFRSYTATFLLVVSILSTGGFFLLGIAQVTTLQQAANYRKGETVTVNLSEIQRE
jgi:methyl-accepting chemotaxis protein